MGMEAGNNFNKKPDGSGRLSRSGFRYNISRNCRWTKHTAEGLPAYREGYDGIDFTKDSRKKEEDK